MKYILYDNLAFKALCSPNYHFIFNKKTGFFCRWGKDKKDDPQFCPFGPELVDIEITTKCNGIPNTQGCRAPCKFCYKSNTPNGDYMTLKTFKKIFNILPKSVLQIAFGVDAQCKTNPLTFKIFKYVRDHGVVPNVTVADIDTDTAKRLTALCGAVAVSRYENKIICYNTIQRLINAGCKQINIHIMASLETYDQILETFNDYLENKTRFLKKINAIVLLSLKQKGRGINYHPLPFDKFKKLVSFATKNKIPIGFDSCSYHKFIKSIGSKKAKKIDKFCEPCESGIFSAYFNSDATFFPCSFMEGKDEWTKGINLLNVKDFVKEVWNHKRVKQWRKKLLQNKRACPCYKV